MLYRSKSEAHHSLKYTALLALKNEWQALAVVQLDEKTADTVLHILQIQ